MGLDHPEVPTSLTLLPANLAVNSSGSVVLEDWYRLVTQLVEKRVKEGVEDDDFRSVLNQ